MANILDPPTWLDKDFLQHALNRSDDTKSEIEVVDFEILPGLPAGVNFCSAVFKTCVRFTRKNQDQIEKQYFFIKTPSGEGMVKELVKDGHHVEKEWKVYNELFPELYKLDKNFEIVTKHYPSKLQYTLILEDLWEEGYKMCDKNNQLDFEHCSIAIESIAKFHAISVAVYHKNPALIESLGIAHMYEFENNAGHKLVEERIHIFADLVEKWKGYERFGKMIRNVSKTCSERLVRVLNTRRNFTVLNHGDTWSNNMLFKYDEQGNVTNMKLVDFQICMYASVGIDLNFFIWSSVRGEVRDHRLEELYSVYLKTLNSHLAQFGCKERLSREELDEEMRFTMFYALYTIFLVSYIIFTDDDGTKSKKGHESVYDKKCFKSNGEQGLIYLEKNGFFK